MPIPSVGGEQLHLVPTPWRRLIELRMGVDDPDDLAPFMVDAHSAR